MVGRAKTSVLPEPVKATPIMSRPERMTGRPCTWIGVGLLIPLLSRCCSTGAGNFMSWNDRMGGGRLWPSVMMWNLCRTAACSSPVICRSFSGGFHPVFMLLVYTTPCSKATIQVMVNLQGPCFTLSTLGCVAECCRQMVKSSSG